MSEQTFLSGHNHTQMQSTAVQRLSGINCIVLACATDDSHPRTYLKCSTPKQMQVNFPPPFTTVHFESISTQSGQRGARSSPQEHQISYASDTYHLYLFGIYSNKTIPMIVAKKT